MKISTILLFLFVFVAVGYSQGNWKLLFPSPTTNQIVGMYFIDGQTGWSVGEYGTILKTTDAGITWTIQEIPWLFDLSDVHFPTALTGYAIGTDGFIIKTTDGGETWNQLENKYSNNLNRILFRDENNGWIIGEKGIILHTSDGGSNWSLQTSNNLENLNGIDFIGTNGVCIAGDDTTIFITHDDGQTWREIEPDIIIPFFVNSLSLKDVFFLDDQHGWIAGDWDTHMVLLTTKDSGETWSMLTDECYDFSFSSGCGGGPALQQIYFYDTTKAIGLCVNQEYTGGGNIIIKTLNAGAYWSSYNRGYNEYYNGKNRFSVMNENKVICTGYHGDFRFSDDQGTSWYVNSEPQHWWDYLIVGNNGQLLAHQLIPSSTLYGSEIDHWFRSSDYGRTWSEFRQQYLDKNNQPIRIPNNQENLLFHGFGNFIGNRDTLWITQRINSYYDTTQYAFISTDFGSTYHEIRRGISSLVSTFLTPDTMIGHNTYIIEQSPDKWDAGIQFNCSFNGGLTVHTFKSRDLWNKLTYTPNFPILLPRLSINAYYFFNGHHGFLVGSDGNIIGTNDTGQSWTNVYSGVVEDLQDITFINERTGFVVGDFGRILKTVDGGATWYKTNSGTQEKIYSIGFINDHEGWVGTENGLRYTKDTGETWRGVPLRYSHGQVHQLLFDDAGNGYAYGNEWYYNINHSGIFEWTTKNAPRSYAHLLRMLNNSVSIQEHKTKSNIPTSIQLSQNYPNPFNATTRIDYYLPEVGIVVLKIYNIQGQLVRTLMNQSIKSGQHSVIWDGRSDKGSMVSSGMYICQLQCNNQIKNRKLLLLK
jgi:photosystem II stability/assembly factor-like uncharacterized protein